MHREKLKETIIQLADNYGYMETTDDFGWLKSIYKVGTILSSLVDTEGVDLHLEFSNYRIDEDFEYCPLLPVYVNPGYGSGLVNKINENGFYMLQMVENGFKTIDDLVDMIFVWEEDAKKVIKLLYIKQ